MNYYKKHHHFFTYVIFGFLASLINIGIFNVCHVNFKRTILLSNTLAWFISNLFSFYCNKLIVFKSKETSIRHLRELSSFFSSRAFSWIFDMLIMYIGVWLLPKHPVFVKIIDQALVGIFNYLITKKIFISSNKNMLQKKTE